MPHNMDKIMPHAKVTLSCESITACINNQIHENSADTVKYSLYDDIQDLLDMEGNGDQSNETEARLATTIDTVSTIEDTNPVYDIDRDIPNMIQLADEVFKEMEIEKQKGDNKHLLETYCALNKNIGNSEVSPADEERNEHHCKILENGEIQENIQMNHNFNNLHEDGETSSLILSSPVNVDDTIDDFNIEIQSTNAVAKAKEVQNAEELQSLTVLLCHVCGAKAGRHTYYGGRSCGPCRAFFRRSVQSKYFEIFRCKSEESCEIKSDSRKKCQFCRFQKCLEAGMKTSWVLTEEERNKRFNKLNKLKSQNSSPKPKESLSPQPLGIPELYMKFTTEEQKMLDNVHQNFKVHQKSWLNDLLLQNKEVGLNVVESMLKIAPLKMQNFSILEETFHSFFTRNIVPKFLENASLPTTDISQIINGQNSAIAHLFKLHQFTKISPKENDRKPEPECSKQVSDLVNNSSSANIEDLVELTSKLSVGASLACPNYEDLYPAHWANNKEVEDRHKEIIRKIQIWPTDEKNNFDYSLVLLLTVILLFNPDYNPVLHRSVVSSLQGKYVTLLQRYIRSKLGTEAANNKFLEATLLLSSTRELWDLSKHHVDLNNK
eukprot:GFUD01015697.1.p1 GENE.GFUD01015697.1~~GFUD01015697.1.p1  ORF type:complete len:606 (+),score=152.84 GFUD01015697.1:2-1819(+)